MKIFGFHNSVDPYRDAPALAITEEGEIVANHFCSNEMFARHDLGMDGTCEWKHEIYNEKFPDGWETEFVLGADVEKHEGLQKAFRLAESKDQSPQEPFVVDDGTKP